MHTPLLTSIQIAAERDHIFSSTYETFVYLANYAAPKSRPTVKLSRVGQNEISVIHIYAVSSFHDTSTNRSVIWFIYLFIKIHKAHCHDEYVTKAPAHTIFQNLF